MVADTATDSGEGVVLLDGAVSVSVASFADEGDIPLSALTNGAGVAARGDASLLNGVGTGDGLRIEAVGGAPLAQTLVIQVDQRHGTDRSALATAGAPGKINIPRFSPQGDGEIARLPCYGEHLGIG